MHKNGMSPKRHASQTMKFRLQRLSTSLKPKLSWTAPSPSTELRHSPACTSMLCASRQGKGISGVTSPVYNQLLDPRRRIDDHCEELQFAINSLMNYLLASSIPGLSVAPLSVPNWFMTIRTRVSAGLRAVLPPSTHPCRQCSG